MLNKRERIDIMFKRLYRRLDGLSLRGLVRKVILGALTMQVLTAVVLLIIATLGKRRKHEIRFPHAPFEEVQVGTCNLDRLSLVGNYEINVAIYSAEFAQHMSALFAEDTSEMFELTMEQWKSRPWYTKASERILAPLRFMM